MYFEKERDWLIDQQLESIASGLLSVRLSDDAFSEMDATIGNILAEEPHVITLNIFDLFGNVLYQNDESISLLGENIPATSPVHFSIQMDRHNFRILNLQLASGHIIQIGILRDKDQLQLINVGKRMLLFAGVLLVVSLFLAYVLSRPIIRPIQLVTAYLVHLNRELGINGMFKEMPLPLVQTTDEIKKLLKGVEDLKKSLNDRLKMNEISAAHMAHEFKTPLTLIRNTCELLLIEQAQELHKDSKDNLKMCIDEVDQLTDLVTKYLNWVRLGHGETKLPVHSISLNEIVKHSLELFYNSSNVQVYIENDFNIIANREEVLQLVRNIFDNAFKHSTPNSVITITVKDSCLSVTNRSEKIPEVVFTHLGRPFNTGKVSSIKSYGLGLSWIMKICQKYGYEFRFSQEENSLIVSADVVFVTTKSRTQDS